MEWIDGFFAQIYKWNHRYLVETIVVFILAFAVHLGYKVLAERQLTQAAKAVAHTNEQNINVRDINNFGDGSHTEVNQVNKGK